MEITIDTYPGAKLLLPEKQLELCDGEVKLKGKGVIAVYLHPDCDETLILQSEPDIAALRLTFASCIFGEAIDQPDYVEIGKRRTDGGAETITGVPRKASLEGLTLSDFNEFVYHVFVHGCPAAALYPAGYVPVEGFQNGKTSVQNGKASTQSSKVSTRSKREALLQNGSRVIEQVQEYRSRKRSRGLRQLLRSISLKALKKALSLDPKGACAEQARPKDLPMGFVTMEYLNKCRNGHHPDMMEDSSS